MNKRSKVQSKNSRQTSKQLNAYLVKKMKSREEVESKSMGSAASGRK